MITGDYHLVKNLNSQIVLNLIRTRGPIYGADLAKITGMRSSTIMNILRNLEKKGLIIKSGYGQSTPQGGKRPTNWEICGNYGYIIGIKVELNEISGILIDLNTKIISQSSFESSRMEETAVVVEKIITIVEQLLFQHKISHKNVLGVGIGVSGAVDYKNGIIVKSALFRENPVQLRQILKKRFDFSIYIENDANAAVLYEKWFGRGQNIRNLVYVLLVINQTIFGIGYGLLLDNHIFRGDHMYAGESKSHSITIKDVLDRLGIGDNHEIEIEGMLEKKEEIDIQFLIDAALRDDKNAVLYFAELAKILGDELARIVDLLDPQVVLLGGQITQVGDYLLKPLKENLQKESILGDHREIRIEFATAQPIDTVAMGAASLILNDIFKSPVLQDV